MSEMYIKPIMHLLKHFACSASHRRLGLVDFALGKAPTILGVVTLHEKYVVERRIKQYGAVGGHTRLKKDDSVRILFQKVIKAKCTSTLYARHSAIMLSAVAPVDAVDGSGRKEQ
jgi:hypothetical protein